MQKKSTTEAPASASAFEPIDPKTILQLHDLANDIQLAIAEASYMAEFSLRQMVENGLNDPEKNKDVNIYFPPREREILRFICDDVGTRINALNELANNLTSALNGLYEQMRSGEDKT